MRLVFVLFLTLLSSLSQGHEIRPALLQIKEIQPGQFEVLWKRPVSVGRTVDIQPEFPLRCKVSKRKPDQVAGKSWASFYRMSCEDTNLKGEKIAIKDLSRTVADALVRIQWLDGSSRNHVLTPDKTTLVLEASEENSVDGLLDYFWLGVEHLITGYDHVLFVIGLLYLGTSRWVLIKIVTAFTLAHSLTLGLSALGLVQLSQGPIEAIIALSILYLAVELLQEKKHQSLLYKKPWFIALVFGLLHGFGFAGALRDVGLPEDAILVALFLFNVGIEAGQLLVVGSGILFASAVSRSKISLPIAAIHAPIWIIGALSSYWFIDRLNGLMTG